MAKGGNTVRRVCCFCGGTPCTEEHIWPKWAHSMLPKGDGHYRRLQVGFQGEEQEVFSRDRQGSTTTIRIRRVCGTCNNEWMSSLEEQAQPVLTKLIRGRRFVLLAEDQDTLAQYFCMKAMVSDGSRLDAEIFNQVERTAFYERQELPSRCQIALLYYPAEINETVKQYNKEEGPVLEIESGRRINQGNFTFRFGSLLIQVVISELVKPSPTDSADAVKIHPRRGFSRAWPVLAQTDESAGILQHILEHM